MNEMRLPVGEHCSTILDANGNPLLSCPRDWDGVVVERKEIPSSAECGPQFSEVPVIVVPLTGHGKRSFRSGLKTREFYSAPPNILVYGESFERDYGRWEGVGGESITVRLPDGVVRGYCKDDFLPKGFHTRYNNQDTVLRRGIIALGTEIQGGFPNGRLYAEGLSISIIGWLITHYGKKSLRSALTNRGFSSAQRVRIVDFVENHIDKNITVDRLAAEVNMSPRLFFRLFRLSFEQSPHQYVMEARIKYAKRLLQNHAQLTMSGVALLSGFSSQAHFCFAFKKYCGMPPSSWRNRL